MESRISFASVLKSCKEGISAGRAKAMDEQHLAATLRCAVPITPPSPGSRSDTLPSPWRHRNARTPADQRYLATLHHLHALSASLTRLITLRDRTGRWGPFYGHGYCRSPHALAQRTAVDAYVDARIESADAGAERVVRAMEELAQLSFEETSSAIEDSEARRVEKEVEVDRLRLVNGRILRAQEGRLELARVGGGRAFEAPFRDVVVGERVQGCREKQVMKAVALFTLGLSKVTFESLGWREARTWVLSKVAASTGEEVTSLPLSPIVVARCRIASLHAAFVVYWPPSTFHISLRHPRQRDTPPRLSDKILAAMSEELVVRDVAVLENEWERAVVELALARREVRRERAEGDKLDM